MTGCQMDTEDLTEDLQEAYTFNLDNTWGMNVHF